jgi:DNA-directed RNA polymerase sigma subunit (sigma70/sigma32)
LAKIAKRYRGHGLPISEIISEGNTGLMQALNLRPNSNRSLVGPLPDWQSWG